jgi:hypothetical protein
MRWSCWTCLLALFLFMLGCAREPGPLWADPGVVRFDTERVEVDVEIHNLSGTARPIGEFALTGEDWGSLRFVDDSLPRTVPVNDSVIVRLGVSRASFRSEPGVYRSGHANLEFQSNKHAFSVPIEFVGTAARQPGAPPTWLAIALLALVALAGLLIPTRGAPRPQRTALASERIVAAGALAAVLLLVANIPFGAGFCQGRTAARVGSAELAQCRAGLGGFEQTLLPVEPGLWWWLIALALIAALFGVVRFRSGSASATIALGFVRTLGFAIVLASLLVGLAPSTAAPIDLALAQLRSQAIGTLTLPAWGLIAQPITCAATIALAISLPTKPSHLERLERLAWSALITIAFLGAWSIPGLSDRPVPALTHAAQLGAELACFAIKIALVSLALNQLAKLLALREVTPSELLRNHARGTIPILLANLLAITIWRVF